jgi:hypothetical protein
MFHGLKLMLEMATVDLTKAAKTGKANPEYLAALATLVDAIKGVLKFY